MKIQSCRVLVPLNSSRNHGTGFAGWKIMSIEGEIPFRSAQTSGQKFVLVKTVIVVD